MELFTFPPYHVELTKGLLRVDVGDIAGTYDENAHRFGAKLFQDGKAVDISGCAVSGYFIRPNGYTVPMKGTVEDNTAWVTLNKNCYYYDGAFTLSVKVTNVGIGTVLVVDGRIVQTQTDSLVDEEHTIPSLEEIYASIETVEQATEAASTAASNANSAAESANDAAGRSPYIGENGHWYIWDKASGKYVDSTNPSIPALAFEVRTGAAGSQVQIEQGGTAEAPVIILTIPRGDTGAVDGVDYYTKNPTPLGTASPGTANGLSRGDHVHPMPTAADVEAVSYNAQSLTDAQKTQAKENLDIVNGLEMKLLWTNASPTSEMGSNTIDLDLSQYAGVTIELYSASNSIPSHSMTSPFIRKNCGWSAVGFVSGASYRRLFHVNDSGVSVASGTTGTTTADKANNIPYKIYGVKGAVS